VSSKEDTFSKELGHKSQGKKLCVFGPSYFSTVGGRTIRIRTISYSLYVFGTEIKAFLGTIFEVNFGILFDVSGSDETVRTTDCWHQNQGMKEVVQKYRFGTENKEELFGGTVLVM
jgi:hypothetical protein